MLGSREANRQCLIRSVGDGDDEPGEAGIIECLSFFPW